MCVCESDRETAGTLNAHVWESDLVFAGGRSQSAARIISSANSALQTNCTQSSHLGSFLSLSLGWFSHLFPSTRDPPPPLPQSRPVIPGCLRSVASLSQPAELRQTVVATTSFTSLLLAAVCRFHSSLKAPRGPGGSAMTLRQLNNT